MASPRKTPWRSVRQFAVQLAFDEVPRVIRQLEQIPAVQQRLQQGIDAGIQLGLEALAGAGLRLAPPAPAGRPVTNVSFPTAARSRRLVYAPDLAGRAEAGEVVWAWVAFGEAEAGRDRPVLVVGRNGSRLLALLLSDRAEHAGDPNWLGIDTADWAEDRRPGWVRLDRVLDVAEEGIRRQGAVFTVAQFELVAAHLRGQYQWS